MVIYYASTKCRDLTLLPTDPETGTLTIQPLRLHMTCVALQCSTCLVGHINFEYVPFKMVK